MSDYGEDEAIAQQHADDPREILNEAGVECPEVEAAWEPYSNYPTEYRDKMNEAAREMAHSQTDAILALARLVAKYKWQRDEAIAEHCAMVEHEYGISHWPTDEQPPTLDDWLDDDEAVAKWLAEKATDLDRRWEELHA